MGAYLSKPMTEKISSDESNNTVVCGASSMQGWRITQEDAHNCILDFDGGASLFAVYDGHGGKEVAEYTSQKLPDFIKQSEAYIAGDYEKGLKDAFLKFDATLKEPAVVEILKEIANLKKDENQSETEEENLNNLKEEAQMPIEEVMAKYASTGSSINPNIQFIKEGDKKIAPVSPYLRAKGSGTSNAVDCSEPSSSSASSSKCQFTNEADSEVSSSSSSSTVQRKSLSEKYSNGESSSKTVLDSTSNGAEEVNNGVSDEKSENVSDVCQVPSGEASKEGKEEKSDLPDSSEDLNKTEENESSLVNGNGTHDDSEAKVEDTISSSVENGEVKVNKGKGKGKSPMKKQPKTPEKKTESPEKLFEKFKKQDPDEQDESDSDSDDVTFPGPDSTSDDDDEVAEGEEDENDDEDEDDEDSEDYDEDEDEDEDEEDEFTMNMTNEPGSDSGCTAVVALLKDDKIYVANAGDSRCIVSKGGEVIEMSIDHKPEDEIEFNRITKAGGEVTSCGRVNGGLNLSRALGDHIYKQVPDLPPEEQMISPLPDVKVIDIDPDVEFVFLACDGIWNSMSSKEVVDFVRPRLIAGVERTSKICEELFDHCLATSTQGDGTGCDNMTAIVVQFKNSNLSFSKKRRAEEETNEADDGSKRQKTEDVSSTDSVETNKPDESSDKDLNTPDTTQ